MSRTAIVVDLSQPNAQPVPVPYTTQQESDADAQNTAWQTAQVPIVANQQRLAGMLSDANVTALLQQASTATTSQIDTWLTNNVTTLVQARTVLGALIKVVSVMKYGNGQ